MYESSICVKKGKYEAGTRLARGLCGSVQHIRANMNHHRDVSLVFMHNFLDNAVVVVDNVSHTPPAHKGCTWLGVDSVICCHSCSARHVRTSSRAHSLAADRGTRKERSRGNFRNRPNSFASIPVVPKKAGWQACLTSRQPSKPCSNGAGGAYNGQSDSRRLLFRISSRPDLSASQFVQARVCFPELSGKTNCLKNCSRLFDAAPNFCEDKHPLLWTWNLASVVGRERSGL